MKTLTKDVGLVAGGWTEGGFGGRGLHSSISQL